MTAAGTLPAEGVFAMSLRGWIGSGVLLAGVVAVGSGLTLWKIKEIAEAKAAGANRPEQMESVTVAVAGPRAPANDDRHRHRPALRSITLRNELPGTVKHVMLTRARWSSRGRYSSPWTCRSRRPS